MTIQLTWRRFLYLPSTLKDSSTLIVCRWISYDDFLMFKLRWWCQSVESSKIKCFALILKTHCLHATPSYCELSYQSSTPTISLKWCWHHVNKIAFNLRTWCNELFVIHLMTVDTGRNNLNNLWKSFQLLL